MHHPDFPHIQQLLTQEHALAEASEAHGTLAGCLCGAAGYKFEDWLREILPEGHAQPAASETLRDVYAATLDALEQPEMGFEPLLPSDAQPIEARTTALAEWCQGFLYGLGAGNIPDASHLPGEVGEIVRDFAEITRAGVDGAESEESNESAYAELVEFVRVGVQLLFEELSAARRAPASAPDDAAPLH
jgi:yecA family protein